MTALFDLSGRTAVVTGARRGIGLAMAEALALAGADIVGVSAPARSGRQRGRTPGARRRAAGSPRCGPTSPTGRPCTGWPGDITALGPIDILVNNGGTIARTPAAEHPDEMWDHVIEVNLSSQFILSREIGRTMVERGRGKIIFTASLLSFQGGITVPGYAASKSGVAGLTKALANEWAAHGVNVNAIAPGYIATDNTQALRDDPDRDRAILEPDPGRAVGPGRRPRRRHGVPGVDRRRTTSTASSCPSTAAGWADDGAQAPGRTRDIVDAHHHLWVRARHPQPWIDPVTMAAIDADFEPADLAPLARAAGVTATVVVQSIASEAETVDLLGVAAEDPSSVASSAGWT